MSSDSKSIEEAAHVDGYDSDDVDFDARVDKILEAMMVSTSDKTGHLIILRVLARDKHQQLGHSLPPRLQSIVTWLCGVTVKTIREGPIKELFKFTKTAVSKNIASRLTLVAVLAISWGAPVDVAFAGTVEKEHQTVDDDTKMCVKLILEPSMPDFKSAAAGVTNDTKQAAKPHRVVVLVDMDGVVANLEDRLVVILNETKQHDVAKKIVGRKHFDFDGETEKACRPILSSAGFYLSLAPVEGCVDALKDMVKQGYDVRFCTKPLNQYQHCVPEKYAWVEKHFGAEWTKRMIVTGDKSLVGGTFLIDDHPLVRGDANPTPSWKHVVFHQSYNGPDSAAANKPRLMRWADWPTVIRR